VDLKEPINTVSIPTLGKRGAKEIPIMMPNSRALHNKIFFQVITRKGE